MPKVVMIKLGNLFTEYINGYAFKSTELQHRPDADSLPLLKIANIGSGERTDFSCCHFCKIAGHEKFIADVGDLAFSLTGSLGYVAIVSERCLVNQRVFVIKRNSDYSELLDVIHPFIKSNSFTNYCFSKATSESNKNISHTVILGLA